MPSPSSTPPAKTPRPVFTYVAFAIAVAVAVWLELTTRSDAEMRGASFVLGASILMTGYGIDWARFTRPGTAEVASALVAAAAAAHAVLFGWLQDWEQVVAGTLLVGAGLILFCWALATLPPRVVEVVFLGPQDGRWLFAHGDQRWELESRSEVKAVAGNRYVIVAKLTQDQGEEEHGPYRGSRCARGKLIDIASAKEAIVRRRRQRAWGYTRGVMTAAALICTAVALRHVDG